MAVLVPKDHKAFLVYKANVGLLGILVCPASGVTWDHRENMEHKGCAGHEALMDQWVQRVRQARRVTGDDLPL